MRLQRLRVPAEVFDALSHGGGDAASARLLRAGQVSKHTVLIRAVIEASAAAGQETATAQLTEAVHVLAAAQRRSPAAFEQVVGYPLVGAWASHCLRRLRHGGEDAVPLWIDLAHLGAVAAAAAIRAGCDVDVAVPVRDGTAALPTLGSARLRSATSWGVATVSCGIGPAVAGEQTVVELPIDHSKSTADWSGLRRLTAQHEGRRLRLWLDDLNPYRGHHQMVAADRLDAAEVARWQSTLDEAWRILVDRHPDRAGELVRGLVAIVPSRPVEPGRQMNATARDSVRAVALTPPGSGSAMATSLVHEHQHSKLGSLLDLVPLYDGTDRRRRYSPWRADPRPLGGLLQGAYAFLAVAGFWRVEAADHQSLPAWFEFARARSQVGHAVRAMLQAGVLTEPGRRFVAGLREGVGEMARVAVPQFVLPIVDLVLDDHQLTWRLRNLRVEADDLEALGHAWLAGLPCPLPEPRRHLPDVDDSTQPHEPRLRLAHLVMTQPDRPPLAWLGAEAADIALVGGGLPDAADGYLRWIEREPDRIDPWAGLAVVRQRIGPRSAAGVYRSAPEVLSALHAWLRAAGGPAPAPDALAGWLADRSG